MYAKTLRSSITRSINIAIGVFVYSGLLEANYDWQTEKQLSHPNGNNEHDLR